MIIFVGQQLSKPGSPHEALAGITGRRLAKLIGIPFERYLHHSRVNVNARFPGAHNGKGDGFDMLEGKREAEKLTEIGRPGDLYVLCGERVARVFGLKYEPFRIHVFADVHFLVLPHPSGRNRFWNVPENRTYCRELFAREFFASL